MTALEPLSPAEGVQLYLEDRKPEVVTSTLHEHRSRLDRFLEFCDNQDISDMREVTSRTAHEYKTWRGDQVAPTTLKFEIRTFRQFLAFCEDMNGVSEGVANKVSIPKVDPAAEVRNVKIEESEAEDILDYLDRFEYASFRHVLLGLLWHAGMRTSTVRALDVKDFYPDHPQGAFLDVVHRPQTGTPLKKKRYGEREVSISDWLVTVLEDYVEHNRHDVTDDYDRHPLLTTQQGRPYKTTIQRNIYSVTRPCIYRDDCPHDREPIECEAMSYNTASKCPSSVSPHAVRRGSTTNHLNSGMPKELVADRLDVSQEVLEKHYDGRSESEKRQLRREYLDSI